VKSLALISLLLLAFQKDTPPLDNQPAGRLLTGTVVDALTGQPIAGAEVIASFGAIRPLFVGSELIVELPGGVLSSETLREGAQRLEQRRAARMPVSGPPMYSVTTDSKGRFAFRNLAAAIPQDAVNPDAYRLYARADRYVLQEWGLEASNTPTSLDAPVLLNLRRAATVTFRLTPLAEIGGWIKDPDGHPLPGLKVLLLREGFYWTGDRRFRDPMETTTDESGHYRLTGIAPGHYYIAAGGPPLTKGRPKDEPLTTVYPWTWYPGVSEPSQASPIALLPGMYMNTFDLLLTPRKPLRISGRVIDDKTGRPTDSAFVSLTEELPFEPVYHRLIMSASRQTMSNPEDGTFEFTGLNAGFYRLGVGLSDDPVSQLRGPVLRDGSAAVVVSDSDVDEVELRVNVGSLSGRFLIIGNKPLTEADPPFPPVVSVIRRGQPQPGGPMLHMYAASCKQSIQAAGVRADISEGTFEMIPPPFGSYRFYVPNLPGNFYVDETRVNGTLVTDGLLDIPTGIDNHIEFMLSPDGGEIQGTVLDEHLVPQAGVRGLLLPDLPPPRAIGSNSREFVTDAQGEFILHGIAPGHYRLFAWKDVDQYGYFDPELIGRSRPDATSVTIVRGGRLQVTVEIIKA
jgi:protocatechuate 3,4-dioxygenase beta subunit